MIRGHLGPGSGEHRGIAWDVWRAGRGGQGAIAARRNRRLADLVAFARARSRFYGLLYASLPTDTSELSQLPPVTKSRLMDAFDDWVTDPAVSRAGVEEFTADKAVAGKPYLGRYLLCTTSGSTGRPGIFLHDADATAVYRDVSLFRGYLAWILPNPLPTLRGGARVAVVIATGAHFAGAVWAERARRVNPMASSRLSIVSVLKPIHEMVEEINGFRPAILIGYPTAMVVLAGEQRAGRLRIRPSLVVTGGECLSPADRLRIETGFRCQVREFYGASEFMGIAFDCGQGWLHVSSDWVILEPVDDAYRPVPPGVQSQTVLLTNLANRVQPLIRYDLGDRVTLQPAPCACGSPFPAIRVEGRRDDILCFEGPGRETVPVLPMAIATVVEETPGVELYQIIQTTPQAISVRLEASRGCDASDVWDAVDARLRAYLAAQGLSWVTAQRSPGPPARDPLTGKFREVWVERTPLLTKAWYEHSPQVVGRQAEEGDRQKDCRDGGTPAHEMEQPQIG